MISFIKKKFIYVSTRGLKESMTISEQKKVILTNQLALLMFIVIFSLMTALSIIEHKVLYLFYCITFTALVIPYLNHIGLYKVTSFMMSVVFPINALIFSTIIKLDFNHNIDISYYFNPRFIILGGLVVPLILIDAKHKLLLTSVILINFSCLILIDPLCELLGVGVNQVNVLFDKYHSINFLIILPYILILFGFMFLQKINNIYETKVLTLMDDLKIKNTDLEIQKKEIAHQKDEIEIINTELTDSIRYAYQIQQAVLPDNDILKKYFKDSFILFKPKDIVSGDFYWIAEVNEYVIIAVFDCTGHGVPGAFMSMLGLTFLEEIVIKGNVYHPSIILSRLRDEIISSLKQKGESGEHKDGMDASIVSINSKTKQLLFAGANNPLYLLRNEVFTEYKGDKMPVAIYEKMDDYSETLIQLEDNDKLYMMSDGYEDQFGGANNKKFKSKQLKELLVCINEKPMNEQNEILSETFNNWKGSYEQIDDVTLLGIKV